MNQQCNKHHKAYINTENQKVSEKELLHLDDIVDLHGMKELQRMMKSREDKQTNDPFEELFQEFLHNRGHNTLINFMVRANHRQYSQLALS